MSTNPLATPEIRDRILSQPDLILDDQDLMRALVAANDRHLGGNVVDMRGIAMERLESRLDRLEDTHRNVIAAAYENLAGTNTIHRAILRLLDAQDFATFLDDLAGPVARTLQVDSLRLLLESADHENSPDLGPLAQIMGLAERGYCCLYGGQHSGGKPRRVTLRHCEYGASPEIHGDKAEAIRSEACLMLDFGEGRLPGMLVLGAEDPEQFAQGQGGDLLDFFAGVFERAMRRWLA
ncbi:DUF484 family protein [Palleronia sp. LCG004]|uniref:DUF484 family protein n=1 Tax=Palleronia sp. LCG004 TaxID=3079304 RepID=UPI0029435CEF|nr:DUF484 family protein [Palleronia sp. LCG004]WOI56429.1 DUF484 family protein [Palleronia sp. LCG004]